MIAVALGETIPVMDSVKAAVAVKNLGNAEIATRK